MESVFGVGGTKIVDCVRESDKRTDHSMFRTRGIGASFAGQQGKSETFMVEIGLGSELGVAMLSYSGRLSRMWAWRISDLEVVGTQDVKGRARLVDITSDGQLASYQMERHHKTEFYVAICRPPYWHALWLKKAFHLNYAGVLFKDSGWLGFGSSTTASEFLIERDGGKVVPRLSGYLSHDVSQRVRRFDDIGFGIRDALGREYSLDGERLFAGDVFLLDLSRGEFREQKTPDWAKRWPEEDDEERS